MRFGVAMMDVAGTDPRTTGGGRAAPDQGAAGQVASGFGGVLAETEARDAKPGVGADATLADTTDAQGGAAPAFAGGTPPPGRPPWPSERFQTDFTTMTSSSDVSRSSLSVPPQGASRAAPTSTSWSTAFAAGMAPMRDPTPTGRDDDAAADAPQALAAGDELEKAVPSRAGPPPETGDAPPLPSQDRKGPDGQGDTTTVASTSTDLMSMLLLSAGVASPTVAPTPTPDGAGRAAATSAGTVARSIDPPVTSQPDDPSSDAETTNAEPADAKATALTGFALETHLAPVAQGPARDGSSRQEPDPRDARQRPASSQPVDVSAGTESSPVAARSDDAFPTRRAADPTAPVGPNAGVVPGAPVRSVAGAIVEMAARAAPAPAEAASTTSPAPIARTLTLQLSPADLGTVDIRLHMSGRTLDVELSISDASTLGLVSRERDALASALADKSYALHSLVIQDGSGSPPPGGHHDSSTSTSGGEPRPDQSGGETGAGQRGGGGRGQEASRRPVPEQRGAASAAPGDRRGTLFV